MSRLQATTSLLSMSPARLHTTLSPPLVPVIPGEGTYKARQRCPYAIALPTLCRRVQWQTCFVADACPCQLP